MPKIRYLRTAPAGETGDVADVTDIEANVLVKTGFAELVADKASQKAAKPKETPKKDD